mgnify:CR=1 FL=1
MLVRLGVILATTVAVLYAILTQPRPVAIGAIVIGLSALIATATPPRIRGGSRYRGSWVRNLLPFLPLMTSGATAEEEYEPEGVNAVPPRPSNLSRSDLSEQVQTVGGCECKPVSVDFATGHRFAESGANDYDGPGWCDVEPGCSNAIDAEPGYDGWDNVLRDPGPSSAVAVRQPPASEEWYRVAGPSTTILPAVERRAAEERRALVRGARVLIPSADNAVAVRRPPDSPDRGFAIAVPPRGNPLAVRPSNPGSALGVTTVAGLAALAGTKLLHQRLDAPATEPKHPLFKRYRFTDSTTESGTAVVRSGHHDSVVLVSLVGGADPVQVHITNSRQAPEWNEDAANYKVWTAAAGDERAYGYTEDDARARVGPEGVATEGVTNECCATLLQFYAPPAAGGLASTNIELQIEGPGMTPDDLAVARLSNVAHWNPRDRSRVVAIRPPDGAIGTLYMHVVYETPATTDPQQYQYWVSTERLGLRGPILGVIDSATNLTERKAMEYFRNPGATRRAMERHPSLSLGQLVQTTEHTSIPTLGQKPATNHSLTFQWRDIGRVVNKLLKLPNLHVLFTEEGSPELQGMVAQARGEFVGNSEHRVYGRGAEASMKDRGQRVKLLHAIHEVKIRRQFIISIIARGLPDHACVYGGNNDCTTHPVRVAEASMSRKLRRESGVWNKLMADGQVATRLDIEGMVASFRDFYDRMYRDTDIPTLPFPTWVVSEDGIDYDRDNEAKNILYHMTHTIILPFLIPILEVRPLVGTKPQDEILQIVYGNNIDTHIEDIERIRRGEPQP